MRHLLIKCYFIYAKLAVPEHIFVGVDMYEQVWET